MRLLIPETDPGIIEWCRQQWRSSGIESAERPESVRIITVDSSDPYVIAAALNRGGTPDEPAILMIDAHFLAPGYSGMDCLGISCLKEIRINGFFSGGQERSGIQQCPVILFSHLDPGQLPRLAPANLLAFSPGTEIIRTYSAIDWDEMLRRFARTPDIIQGVRQYLNPSVIPRLVANRHSYANLFGACILQSISHLLDGRAFEELESLPVAELREAMFLYDRNLFGLNLAENRTAIAEARACIREQLRFDPGSGQYARRIALIEDEGRRIRVGNRPVDLGWQKVYNRLLTGSSDEEVVEDILQHAGAAQPSMLEQLTGLYATGLPTAAQLDALAQRIARRILEAKCSCLLLDLRLVPVWDTGRELARSSGAALLECLRRILPTFPIIVTTASNKPDNHRRLAGLGADAVWVKEGIDEGRTPADSVANYHRLLHLVRHMTGREYQFLKRMGNRIRLLENDKKVWWKQPIFWQHRRPELNKRFDLQEPAQIITVLNQAAVMIRRYLSETYLHPIGRDHGREGERELVDNLTMKNIIRHLGLIVEMLHDKHHGEEPRTNAGDIGGFVQTTRRNRQTGKTEPLSPPRYLLGRCDWVGFALFQWRNECSHYFQHIRFAFDSNSACPARSVVHFVSCLLAYLSQHRPPYQGRSETDLRQTRAPEGANINPDYLDWLMAEKDWSLETKEVQKQQRRMEVFTNLYREVRYGKG